MAIRVQDLLDLCLEGDRFYDEDRIELVRCVLLRMAAQNPRIDPTNEAHQERVANFVDRAIQRRAPRFRRGRRRPSRARFRRARAARPPRDSGCVSCGNRRACKARAWTREEAIAWVARNCQTGERTRRPGPAVGGTLAEARRAPGLWDWDRPVESGATLGDPGWNPRAAEAAAALRAEAIARGGDPLADPAGIMTARGTSFGGPGALGVTCQSPGSTLSCDDPRTGISRSWAVTGRTFTPAEAATFMREQCTPRCDFQPVGTGAPPDAVTRVRRVAPRNLGVRNRANCARQAPPPAIPPRVLTPLAPLDPTPAAEVPRPACVPDTVIGVDGGLYGSGWYVILRRGQRLLVPNPELCGGSIPAQFR